MTAGAFPFNLTRHNRFSYLFIHLLKAAHLAVTVFEDHNYPVNEYNTCSFLIHSSFIQWHDHDDDDDTRISLFTLWLVTVLFKPI